MSLYKCLNKEFGFRFKTMVKAYNKICKIISYFIIIKINIYYNQYNKIKFINSLNNIWKQKSNFDNPNSHSRTGMGFGLTIC